MKFTTTTATFLSLLPTLTTAYTDYTPDLSNTFSSLLSSLQNSSGTHYPTDLTRNIVPKPMHSHNDYWRDIPFYSALSYGAVSIEADVWLINNTLYVGHELQALTPARTFDSLYINPILSVLHAQNPITVFNPTQTHNGVFDTDSGQTLYLFVDIKTDGASTFARVLEYLQPLLQGGWLSTYTNGSKTITSGAVTVIGTGNTPLSAVQALSPRYAFYDAPLPSLNQSQYANITGTISPIASTDFVPQFGDMKSQAFNQSSIDLLRAQVATAHSRGIAARYWDQPGWPIGTRNAIWRILVDEGVDLINVDDLAGAAAFWDGDSFDGLGAQGDGMP